MISLFDGSRHLRVVTSSRLGAGVERRLRVAAGHRAATQPLTAASPEPGCEVTTRRCRWRHEDDFRGEPRLGRDIASQTCIRLIDWDQNHDACMRIGGEAPGGGSILGRGAKAKYSIGSPPPRMSSAGRWAAEP